MELEAPSLEQEEVFLSKDTEIAFGENVIFEEYKLTKNRDITNNILESFKGLVSDTVWRDMPKKLAIVSDEMFRYFVENTCEIAQHIKIDDGKGVVAKGALFSQENVPSETLFYAVMNERENGMVDVLEKGLQDENNLLQIGADITTGLGWCSVKLV